MAGQDEKAELNKNENLGRYFEICVKGQLSEIWADWFEGLTVEMLDCGEMCLAGYIIDQAALMGVLNKINRLNLTLLRVEEIDRENKKKEE